MPFLKLIYELAFLAACSSYNNNPAITGFKSVRRTISPYSACPVSPPILHFQTGRIFLSPTKWNINWVQRSRVSLMWEWSKKEAGNVLKNSLQFLSVIYSGDKSTSKDVCSSLVQHQSALYHITLRFCSYKQKIVQANLCPESCQLHFFSFRQQRLRKSWR